jgi:hypothetical protein
MTEIQSTVLPTPTRDVIRQQQPELGEDDLYMDPPVRNPPVPGSIMKMLPKNTFDIDTPTSLFYFGVDLLAVVATMGFLDIVVTSDNYHALPIWAQALCVAPLQVLTGFAMWYESLLANLEIWKCYRFLIDSHFCTIQVHVVHRS